MASIVFNHCISRAAKVHEHWANNDLVSPGRMRTASQFSAQPYLKQIRGCKYRP